MDIAGHVGIIWPHDPRQRGEKWQVRPLDRMALGTRNSDNPGREVAPPEGPTALRGERTSTCLVRVGCSLTGQTRGWALFPRGRGGQEGGPTPGAWGDGGDFW